MNASVTVPNIESAENVGNAANEGMENRRYHSSHVRIDQIQSKTQT